MSRRLFSIAFAVLPVFFYGQQSKAPDDNLTALIRIDSDITVNSTLKDVWNAFTTKEGLSQWMAPNSEIELIPGGVYELYFNPESKNDKGMVGTKMLSYIPLELLSYTGELPNTWVVWRFRQLADGRVYVHYTGLGFGEEWAKQAPYFNKAMPTILSRLDKYLRSERVD